MKAPLLDQSLRLVSQLFYESALDTADSATVALVVLDGKRVYLGLVMQLTGDEIRSVRDFDSLHLQPPLTISAEAFERLWQSFAPGLKPPTAALLCDRSTFEGLVSANNKLSYLAAVGHAQPYIYRVELN